MVLGWDIPASFTKGLRPILLRPILFPAHNKVKSAA